MRRATACPPDTFLLSKGHGSPAQYVVLEELGVLSRADLEDYCKPGGRLGTHPDYGMPGIEASTGSLGHGLSMVVGMALAERGQDRDGMSTPCCQRRRAPGRLGLGGR